MITKLTCICLIPQSWHLLKGRTAKLKSLNSFPFNFYQNDKGTTKNYISQIKDIYISAIKTRYTNIRFYVTDMCMESILPKYLEENEFFGSTLNTSYALPANKHWHGLCHLLLCSLKLPMQAQKKSSDIYTLSQEFTI